MKNIFIFLTALLLPFLTNAQRDTVINKDVVVVKEYNPTVSDANKINLMPEPQKPQVYKPVFSYGFFSNPIETAFSLQPLAPASLSREPQRTYRQNYVSLAMGNYPTLAGELYYNAFRSEKHDLTFHAKSGAGLFDIRLEDDKMSEADYFKNELLLSYRRQFWNSFLTADLSFDNYNYRYYGFQTLDPTSDAGLYLFGAQDTVMVAPGDIHPSKNPGFASFKTHVALASNPSAYDDMEYKGAFLYDHFFTRFGFMQDHFNLYGNFAYPIGENRAGIDVSAAYNLFNTPSDTNYKFENFTLIEANPYFEIKRATWDIKFGVNSFFVFEKDNNEVLVTPNVALNFNLIDNLFKGYFNAGGSHSMNDYRNIIRHNPYLSPEIRVESTSVPLSFEAGLFGQLTPKIVFNGSVNFSLVENHPFFVNRFYTDSAGFFGDAATSALYANLFEPDYDDMNVLTVKAAIDYSGNDRYNFGLKGVYNNYSLDELEYAWHLPEYEIELYGSFIPYKNVRVNGSFKTIGAREALVESGSPYETKTLNAVYDLSFSGEYAYTNRITAFAKLNNLLGSKYYVWNGYPTVGFNAMVGVKYKF
jgi:hypothetical protein